jgi:hypothetical protein
VAKVLRVAVVLQVAALWGVGSLLAHMPALAHKFTLWVGLQDIAAAWWSGYLRYVLNVLCGWGPRRAECLQAQGAFASSTPTKPSPQRRARGAARAYKSVRRQESMSQSV